MKKLKFNLFLFVLISMIWVEASAYDFTQSGLCYNITSSSERTVAVAGQTQDHTTLVIPSEVTYNGVTYSVTSIANNAFYKKYSDDNDITSLTLPESIKEIGDQAFAHNRISEVDIPASVQHIGRDAFGGTFYYWYGSDSEDYDQVCYPETYTVSNDNLFYSSYKGILYDKDKTKLIDCPDGYSGDIYLPSSLKEIPSGAFNGWNKHNLYIYDFSRFCEINVTGSIGSIYGKISNIYRYYNNSGYDKMIYSDGTLGIPADVTKIGRGIFYGCKSFTNISFPTNGVTEIGDYAFGATKITTVTLPTSLQSIGSNAFYGTWTETIDTGETDYDNDPIYEYKTWTMAMSSLVIPQHVQSIGSNAFNLTNNASVTSKNTSPTNISIDAFKNATNCTLAVGEGLQSTYSQMTGWNAFGTILEDETLCPYMDGEVFTATTAEGIEMTFKVLSVANKTVQVGDGSNPAIDQSFDGDLVIPSQINGLSVTDVGCQAFYKCQNLQSVEIQEGIVNLGQNGSDRNWTYGPFFGSKIAHSVVLPNTLAFIGMVSFYNAEIGDITLPSSLNSIALWAFRGAKIGSLNIPYSETELYCYYDKSSGTNYEVFEGAQIGTLTLDRSISPNNYPPFKRTEIEELHVGSNGHAVFSGGSSNNHSSITEYYPKVEETLKMDGSFSNSIAFDYTYCSNVHLPEGYITIQKVLDCTSYMNIPSTVTAISANAGINLDQPLVLPSGIQTIGDNAITRASSVTALAEYPISINEAAFSSSVYQKTLYVPSGAKERYESATGWNKFANIIEFGDLGEPIQFTDEHVKRVCVREYDINGDGELSEGEAALVTHLSFYSTIYRNNPTVATFDEISYFTGLTSIGYFCFAGWSGLTSFTIPEGVLSIDGQAFNGCSSLASISIPSSVTGISGEWAFNCPNLTSVRVDIEEPISGGSSFSNRANATLYVPAGSKEAYEAADYWKEFKEIKEIKESTIYFADANVKALCVDNWDTDGDGELSKDEAAAVTDLGEVFKGNEDITSFDELQYFTGLTSIVSYAFSGCSGLTSVTIPSSVASIGNSAFYGCSGLTSVTIPNSVTSIGVEAFAYCSGLTSINIPNSGTSIGRYAFRNCSGLASVTIPNSMTSFDTSAFDGCSGLTSVTLNKNSIVSYNYTNQSPIFIYLIFGTQVKEYILGENVTSIGTWAFRDCSGLTSVTISNSVTSIGRYAFDGCSGLTSVTIPNSVTSIGNFAFYDCI